MADERTMRLSQAARVLNIGVPTVVSHLTAKGFKVDNNPNTKLNAEQLDFLAKDFKSDALMDGNSAKKPVEVAPQVVVNSKTKLDDDTPTWFRSAASEPAPAIIEAKPAITKPEPDVIRASAQVTGLKVIDKIDLNAPIKPIQKPVEPVVEKQSEPIISKVAPAPVVTPVPVQETKVSEPVIAEPKIEKADAAKHVVDVPPPPVEEKRTPAPVEESKPQPEIKAPIVIEKALEKVVAEEPKIIKEVKTVEHSPAKEKTAAAQTSAPAKVNQPEKPKATVVVPTPPPVVEKPAETELIEAKGDQLKGLTILGKIQLPVERRGGNNNDRDKKGKRKRVHKGEKIVNAPTGGGDRPKREGDNRPNGDRQAPRAANQAPQTGGAGAANRPATTGGATTGTNNNAPSNNNNNNTGNTGGGGANNRNKGGKGGGKGRETISQKAVDSSIKATFARLNTASSSGKNFGAGKRREKRKMRAEAEEGRLQQEQEDSKILKVTEFISANDLSSMMDVSVSEVISVCLSMGVFVSINQRLDAESITLIADEFGYEIQFISAEEEVQADIQIDDDKPEDMLERAPVVTIMGHVDHGKTSLLDYIRRTRVAAGEAGGITQHIGAYNVKTDTGRKIAFLDTPGHEAFTAMRARGAKVTDVAIIVIAADDSVMPQTREAINHAQLAGVPIVFAFSKVDKPGANTEKVREELSMMNILVEEWGGKYQTQEISSKSGLGIPDLLEKVLLEADLLELKSNPNRRANGTIVEASLDKGRGYMATVLVQNGTLKIGDIILAGANFGRAKAMFDSRGEKIKEAGPSTPVLLLGLNGAPQAGDKFNVMETEREAREIATKRAQIIREQSIRTRKHITLEEIGRRKAIGSFKELNVIVKGDVDGSVEALSDSLLKLSTEEVQVNIIHKAVGQISESDINLAIASDAVVIGFQVRPSGNSKKLAEQEQIEIRLYSIIYDAINDVKDAMVGMLEPTVEEIISGTVEVRDVFKITKVGTVAGCYVTEGVIKRNNRVRVVRDFIVIHEGDVTALKRFKDDASDVRAGFECGVSIRNFNDLQIGDILESFETREVKRTL
jgi:translation initiation factor IF-2